MTQKCASVEGFLEGLKQYLPSHIHSKNLPVLVDMAKVKRIVFRLAHVEF